MHFTDVKMVCQNIHSKQETRKKHFLILSVVVLSGAASGLCIVGDWCTALQSQKNLPSSSAQMESILKFIFIWFKNMFVPWCSWHLTLTARCPFCSILESLVLLSYCFVTSHHNKPAATKIMDGTSSGTAFVVSVYQAPKILVNLDKIPASVVPLRFSTNVPYKRLLHI